MEDLKIRVNSEAESEDAQCLFFELGYRWLGGHGSSYFKINDNFKYITAYMRGMSLAQGTNGDAKKEITMLQLRDMVVLQRNDISDATHENTIKQKLLKASSGWYIFNTLLDVWEWNGEYLGYQPTELKPITKEPVMKEFLNPDQGYKLVCCAIGETSIPENWIEIPEGATSYNQYTRGDGDNEFFIKLVGDTYGFANEDNSYTWGWYGGSLKGHEFVLWQRETLNDKVASAEVARQEFIGAPFSDLPEFNFGAIDDFVESNVEQDNVNQPSHYNKGGVECIDAIQSSMTHEAFCGYLKGNVQKYMWRYENKGGVESLEKAQWYLNKLIEVRNENSSED